MEYLWQFYLLVFVVFIQGMLCIIKQEKVYLSITFMELFFISAFRASSVGNDTESYMQIFQSAIIIPNNYMENGFILFNKLLIGISQNPQAILITTSFIILVGIFYFIKTFSISYVVSLICLIVCGHYGFFLSGIRNSMALSITAISTIFIVKRQFILFLLCVVLATSFHTSAIFFIPIYFIYNWEFKIKNLSAIIIVTLIILLFFTQFTELVLDLFNNRYEVYLGNRILSEETKIASIFKTIIPFVIFAFYYLTYKAFERGIKSKKFPMRIEFLLLMSLITFCLYLISINATILERIGRYYDIFIIISLPYFISLYPRNIRLLIICIIVICFIIYQTIIFVYRPDWNYILPYRFCFYK